MIAWLAYCFFKTGHEFALERVYREGYRSWRNMQRKNWMILLSLSVLGMAFYPPELETWESIIQFVLWAYFIQEFIHEFGLSWARQDLPSFGEVGTSAIRDVVFHKLHIGKTLARVYFTLPAIVLTYLIIRGR